MEGGQSGGGGGGNRRLHILRRMTLTCFGSPGLLLQGHQQGGQHQLHTVGTQVPHHGLGTVVSGLEGHTRTHTQRVLEVQQMFSWRSVSGLERKRENSPLGHTGSRLRSKAGGVAARGPRRARTASPACCTASQRQTELLETHTQFIWHPS